MLSENSSTFTIELTVGSEEEYELYGSFLKLFGFVPKLKKTYGMSREAIRSHYGGLIRNELINIDPKLESFVEPFSKIIEILFAGMRINSFDDLKVSLELQFPKAVELFDESLAIFQKYRLYQALVIAENAKEFYPGSLRELSKDVRQFIYNFYDAGKEFEKLLEKSPNNPFIIHASLFCYLKENEVRRDLQDVMEDVRLRSERISKFEKDFPEFDQTTILLGDCYNCAQDMRTAALNTYLEVKPKDAEQRYLIALKIGQILSMYYMDGENGTKAINYFKDALKENVDNITCYIELQKLYDKMGQEAHRHDNRKKVVDYREKELYFLKLAIEDLLQVNFITAKRYAQTIYAFRTMIQEYGQDRYECQYEEYLNSQKYYEYFKWVFGEEAKKYHNLMVREELRIS